jgi:hypothetical protein
MGRQQLMTAKTASPKSAKKDLNQLLQQHFKELWKKKENELIDTLGKKIPMLQRQLTQPEMWSLIIKVLALYYQETKTWDPTTTKNHLFKLKKLLTDDKQQQCLIVDASGRFLDHYQPFLVVKEGDKQFVYDPIISRFRRGVEKTAADVWDKFDKECLATVNALGGYYDSYRAQQEGGIDFLARGFYTYQEATEKQSIFNC